MRRFDKEIKDNTIINEILTKSHICRIALHDDEFPYVITLNYGYKDNSLYFHCAKEGKKLDLIRRNNKVGFIIEFYHEIIKSEISCKWATKFRSVMGTGKIEIISDFDKKKEGLDIIMQHHGKNDNKYDDKAVDSVYVLKLGINNLSAKQSGQWG